MLFSALVIIFIAVVTYYHYTQGLFTAAISLGCALIAVLIAFGYYEDLLNMAGQGKMADVLAGAMLMMLFGVTYFFLRIIFDAIVPGNVSFPLYVERIGAAVMGFLVGVLATGTAAVAIQYMPFGPSVMLASRFSAPDRDPVTIPATVYGLSSRAKDSGVAHELETNSLDSATASNLILPADSWVVSLVGLASSGGLGGSQVFTDIHPDLLTETFADRLGADTSTARTIFNTTKKEVASVTNIYSLPAGVIAMDSEIPDIRPDRKSLTLGNKATDSMLVVRVSFDDMASDKDGILRITPAAIRLVVDGVNYHPIGTMAGPRTIGLNRLDDQIPVVMSGKFRAAEFVFDLPKTVTSKLIVSSKFKKEAGFIEFKLFGRVDFSGMEVKPYPGPSDTIQILRKPISPLGVAAAAEAAKEKADGSK